MTLRFIFFSSCSVNLWVLTARRPPVMPSYRLRWIHSIALKVSLAARHNSHSSSLRSTRLHARSCSDYTYRNVSGSIQVQLFSICDIKSITTESKRQWTLNAHCFECTATKHFCAVITRHFPNFYNEQIFVNQACENIPRSRDQNSNVWRDGVYKQSKIGEMRKNLNVMTLKMCIKVKRA